MIINYILENDKYFIGVIISALMIMLFSIFSFKIISKIKTGTEKKVFFSLFLLFNNKAWFYGFYYGYIFNFHL